MATDTRKVCFVVMGFGKKTDYESGRTLDLDATYDAIIRPAAEALNMRCIRADEIMHAGVIDVEMFEMLLRAELVVADISTGNVNAVYELGVRHALRPNSTIIMKEEEGKLYFDLNHTSTFKYAHLGADIGAREARRASLDMAELMRAVLASERPDSPVYTYLPRLQKPRLSDEQYESLLADAEAEQETFSQLIRAGEAAMRRGDHADAAIALRAAIKIKANEPFLVQQLALNVYKSAQPSAITALIEARTILEQLSPFSSNDPETLGITGAVSKRLWEETGDIELLNDAIRLYGRGFEVRRDYYNGENFATCLSLRASLQSDRAEATYDTMSARKVREALLSLLVPITMSPSFEERSDRKWVFATLASCCFALGEEERGQEYERQFMAEGPAGWEAETYRKGKAALTE